MHLDAKQSDVDTIPACCAEPAEALMSEGAAEQQHWENAVLL
jgi:hypothetical protein